MIIGLTGTIAAGKTTVAEIFKEKGVEHPTYTDKKSLFKHALILAEKMLIRQGFFVFFGFPESSGG